MKLLDDTQPEARAVWIEAHRRISPARTWRLLDDAYRFSRSLHAAGYRALHPGAGELDVHLDWIKQSAGDRYADLFPKERIVITPSPEQSRVIAEVVAAIRNMGLTYALGGSQASSIHGIRRGTEDADFTIDPFPGREAKFAAQFGPDYYADVPMMQEANRNRSSFNLIHWPTGFKVDLFINQGRPFDLSVMSRRQSVVIDNQSGETIDVVSPEDIILHKLDWFRIGGEISDRQWGDILGVLRKQADRLDETYLEHWANELSLNDLLRRAREQV